MRDICVHTIALCFVVTSVLLCIGAGGRHSQRNEVERRGLQLVPLELMPQSWPEY